MDAGKVAFVRDGEYSMRRILKMTLDSKKLQKKHTTPNMAVNSIMLVYMPLFSKSFKQDCNTEGELKVLEIRMDARIFD